MKHEDGTLASSRGYQLYWQAWLPDGDLRASVQVFHGLGEHSGRYANVVDKLVPAGFAVLAHDHHGHGRSDGPRCHVRKFDDFIEDGREVAAHFAEIFPTVKDKKRFLLGHSMGSLIAFYTLLEYPGSYDGLVLSGFGTRNGSEVSGLVKALSKVISKVAPKLAVDPKLGYDFISRDPEVVEAYHSDPLVTAGRVTARLGAELMRVQDAVANEAPKLDVPLLVQCGSADTAMVGHEDFAKIFKMEDYTEKVYGGLRHEVYNELKEDREKVLSDLLAWLEARA
ncbi:MAG: monoacylglycerol lipase [Promethearchaeota archaeon]